MIWRISFGREMSGRLSFPIYRPSHLNLKRDLLLRYYIDKCRDFDDGGKIWNLCWAEQNTE